jgi:hypothetical protein
MDKHPEMTCPIDGSPIIPDLGVLMLVGPKRFVCPACQRMHEMKGSRIIDVGELPDTKLRS